MLTSRSTKFPHKRYIIQMNLNAIVPNVHISLISFCIKMLKATLLSNVTEACSCKKNLY